MQNILPMTRFRFALSLAALVAALASAPIAASGPTFWTVATSADFLKGTSEGVYVTLSGVVTALGAPDGTANAVLTVSTTTPGARIATYAAIIDQKTNDPRTVLP